MVSIEEPVWKSTYCVILWNHNHNRFFEVSLRHGTAGTVIKLHFFRVSNWIKLNEQAFKYNSQRGEYNPDYSSTVWDLFCRNAHGELDQL